MMPWVWSFSLGLSLLGVSSRHFYSQGLTNGATLQCFIVLKQTTPPFVRYFDFA